MRINSNKTRRRTTVVLSIVFVALCVTAVIAMSTKKQSTIKTVSMESLIEEGNAVVRDDLSSFYRFIELPWGKYVMLDEKPESVPYIMFVISTALETDKVDQYKEMEYVVTKEKWIRFYDYENDQGTISISESHHVDGCFCPGIKPPKPKDKVFVALNREE